MSAQLNVATNLSVEICCVCGVAFAMPTELRSKRLEDGKAFWCANGHNQHFSETEVVRLKRELDKANLKVQTAEREAAWEKGRRVDAEVEAARAEKRQKATKTRLKNLQARVAKGYCPCCKKNFPEVYAHIVEEHPKYAADHPEVVSAGVKGLLPANGGAR